MMISSIPHSDRSTAPYGLDRTFLTPIERTYTSANGELADAVLAYVEGQSQADSKTLRNWKYRQ
ncbi:MAG: hypothetical protein AAF355_11900 [Myxococcota bacterium]